MNVYLDLLLLCAARWWNGLLARQPPRLVTLGDARMIPPHPTPVVERTSADPSDSGLNGDQDEKPALNVGVTPHFRN